MKKYFNDNELWNAFLYGSLLGMFTGIAIGYLMFS